jgi:hypothetical protein
MGDLLCDGLVVDTKLRTIKVTIQTFKRNLSY